MAVHSGLRYPSGRSLRPRLDRRSASPVEAPGCAGKDRLLDPRCGSPLSASG